MQPELIRGASAAHDGSMFSRSQKYRCLQCDGSDWDISSTIWICRSCGKAYRCIDGIVELYLEEKVGGQDRKLRDRFYDGLFGSHYQFLMPLLILPARPIKSSRLHWVVYGLVLFASLGALAGGAAALSRPLAATTILCLIFPAFAAAFFLNNPYLFYLLLLAIPTKASLHRTRFRPRQTFTELHAATISKLKTSDRTLQVLDVSTGSCNSLYKHGWMDLDAQYTGIDLSTTMLRRGRTFMAENGIAVDLVLGDAMNLPFQNETFDVVLSYGAVNAITNPAHALAEMSRVAKPGAVLLFLDEQLYEGASPIERLYFNKVLSSHNVIHRCPIDQMPSDLEDIQVFQVYEFYYICVAVKRSG